MPKLTASTIENLTDEQFIQFANAVLDQLHDEENFELGDPCMLNICGLDYTPTGIEKFREDVEEASVYNIPIRKDDDFQLIMMMLNCPSAEIVPFIATRKYVEQYIVNNVLPMLVSKSPVIFLEEKGE